MYRVFPAQYICACHTPEERRVTPVGNFVVGAVASSSSSSSFVFLSPLLLLLLRFSSSTCDVTAMRMLPQPRSTNALSSSASVLLASFVVVFSPMFVMTPAGQELGLLLLELVAEFWLLQEGLSSSFSFVLPLLPSSSIIKDGGKNKCCLPFVL